jgi:hypothetical protein
MTSVAGTMLIVRTFLRAICAHDRLSTAARLSFPTMRVPAIVPDSFKREPSSQSPSTIERRRRRHQVLRIRYERLHGRLCVLRGASAFHPHHVPAWTLLLASVRAITDAAPLAARI